MVKKEEELEKAEKQFKEFDENIKSLTQDRMNLAPKHETEPQTKLSQKDIEKSKEIYLKPKRSVSCREKFNETYREDYNFQKEYVQFIAENKEIIGEDLDLWTKPFAGIPGEEWIVPTNKPVWGPRYLAEQITRAVYHRLKMQQSVITGSDSTGQFYGQMIADETIERLVARPVSTQKSIFMGSGKF